MSDRRMTCETFDERLADWLEESLAPADAAAMESHIAACLRCAGIVRDLTDIRAAAAALPELRPSRDLWSGIAARIEAPVIPLVAPAPRAGHGRRLRTGLMAAGLVIATAGITNVLTLRSIRGREAATPIASVAAPSTEPVDSVAVLASARDTFAAPAEPDAAPGARNRDAARSAPAPRLEAPSATVAGRSPTQVTYDREIARLRAIIAERSAELDPRTVAVLDNSLKVIDDAISQSRAALAADPGSRFLNKQLDNALDKKLELLRTTALLPARS